jgi:tRNA (cytidine/uridine-2'-O-)-methyltransferase
MPVSNIIHVALVEPEIHPNTGNIARTCAANNIPLHLVGNPGFRTDERSVKRAGLDYWPFVDLRKEADLEALKIALKGSRLVYFSARAERLYTDFDFQFGDCLVFGPESRGLPTHVLVENSPYVIRIPMISENVRSLNLATAVGIAVYEALRQVTDRSFRGSSHSGIA